MIQMKMKNFTQLMTLKRESFEKELKSQIDLIDTIKDAREIYDPEFSFNLRINILEKAFELDEMEFILKICKDLSKDKDLDLIRFLNLLRNRISSESQCKEPIINLLLDLLDLPHKPFETFCICRCISKLVTDNKQFPTKQRAVKYFETISTILKDSTSYYGYLNCIHILSNLTDRTFPKKEVQLLINISKYKKDAFPKDLFCGIKKVDLERLKISLNDSEDALSVNLEMWDLILNNKQVDISRNRKAFIAFVITNNINFEIQDEFLVAKDAKEVGFTSKVFNIVKKYEIKKEEAEKVKIDTQTVKIPRATPKNHPIVAKTTKVSSYSFPNRFSKQNNRIKVLNKFAPVEFKDEYFDKRSEMVLDEFKEKEAKLFEHKKLLREYFDTVSSLHNNLAILIKEADEKRREEEEKKRKEEEKAREAQAESQRWINKAAVRPTNLNIPQGLYKAPSLNNSKTLNTLNSSNYVPPHLLNKNSSFNSSERSTSAWKSRDK